MKDKTNKDEYKPTNAEEKLLGVLLNPEHRFLSITDTCKEAKVVRDIYYKAFKKPKFVAYYKKRSLNLVDQSLGPVINTFKKMAIAGSFQHGKALLEMGGLHLDKIGLVDKDGENINFNVNFVDPPAEEDA